MLTVIVILFVLALIVAVVCRKKNLKRGRHSSFDFDEVSLWGSHHDFTDGGGGDGGD